MTDNEIVETLQYCSNPNNTCEICVLYNETDDECKCANELRLAAVNLINRQQAEIGRLTERVHFLCGKSGALQGEIQKYQTEIETLKTNCLSMAQTMPNMAKAERAEAIKEFAKMLKKDWVANRYNCPDLDVLDWIDHFVKEMVGAENAK